MKIFGIGLNKTGTKTLGTCLKHFGNRHISCDFNSLKLYSAGNFAAVCEIIDQYDSFEDWPWPLMYELLDKNYPDGKFILTVRKSPEIWFQSLVKHANRTGKTEFRKVAYGHEMPHGFKEEHIAFYKKHNQDVLEYFSNKPGKLLKVCWENGDGWKEICPFLEKEIPGIPFPHDNKHLYLDEKFSKQQEKKKEKAEAGNGEKCACYGIRQKWHQPGIRYFEQSRLLHGRKPDAGHPRQSQGFFRIL